MGNDISLFSSNKDSGAEFKPEDDDTQNTTSGKEDKTSPSSQPSGSNITENKNSILHKRKRDTPPKQNKKRKKEKTTTELQKPWGFLVLQSSKKAVKIDMSGKKFRIGFKKDKLVFDQKQAFSEDVKRVCDLHFLPNSQVVLGPADEHDVQIRLNDNFCPRFLNLLNSGDSISVQVNLDITHIFDLIFIHSKDEISTKQNAPSVKEEQQDFGKDKLMNMMKESVIKSDNIKESLDQFPYYLSPKTRQQLLDYGYLYLKKPDFSKFTSQCSTGGKRILLGGGQGSEMYQETLAKSLAKNFGVNFISFDWFEYTNIIKSNPSDDKFLSSKRQFIVGDRVIFVENHSPPSRRILRPLTQLSGPKPGAKGTVVRTFGPMGTVGVKFDNAVPGGSTLLNTCEDNHGYFVSQKRLKLEKLSDDELAVQSLFDTVLHNQPCVVFIKQVSKVVAGTMDRYNWFKEGLDKLENCACIIFGSTIASDKKKTKEHGEIFLSSGKSALGTAVIELPLFEPFAKIEKIGSSFKPTRSVHKLFPNKVFVYPPDDPSGLESWKDKIKQDTEQAKKNANISLFRKTLEKNNMECKTLEQSKMECHKKFSKDSVEKMVAWTLSHHLQNAPKDTIVEMGQKLVIDFSHIDYALDLFQKLHPKKDKKNIDDIDFDNEFEKNLSSEVIPHASLGVKFEDIGALEKVKETLIEIVMLPLQRPELFRKGNLTKPCKGILLFGPPGTGKTMLAKAIATEANANFINISMSSIASKWFGEGEKYVRALFSLASKLKPAIIFIDEVDSILGRRDKHGEHEGMRKIKNEFMSCWDGLRSTEGVILLAATNRPFDLDDAVLRRLPRRLLVDLPTKESRIQILKVILKDEQLNNDVNFEKIADLTEGYSGSDLYNMCKAAAYNPIKEILRREKENKKTEKLEFRPLTMKDFESAQKEISSSVSENAISITELRKWNELYGEGGARNKDSSLSYYL